jgi:rhamnogalacturonyl hydrolase YesR
MVLVSSSVAGCKSTTSSAVQSTGGSASGGQSSAGGATSSGGATGAGGSSANGGTVGAGGTSSSGGTASSGGATAVGGTTGSGGASSSGGATKSGGVSGSGGLASSGGATGGGGATVATGGASTVGSGGAKTGGAGGGNTGAGGATATGGGTSNDGSIGSGGAGSGGSGGSSGSSGSCPTISDFSTWPTGKGPLDIGKLATTNFKSHTGDGYGGAGYAWAFCYYGALRFTTVTGDSTTDKSLITAFEPYASGATAAPDNSATATVDYRAFGVLPLEIFIENQDARCKTLGLARADQQWVSTTSDGITSDARYWSDDMYMITGLQVMAYRATQDTKYLNRSAQTMIAYMAALQQSDGFFWHTKQSKAYWGRANGWVAAGMTELLLELPNGSTRDSIMAGYKKLIDALLTVQISGGADDGAWRQVLDLTSAPAEMSCTAMFTYALVNGAKNNWLTDPKYSAAAKKGWTALGNKTNSSGQLSAVCPGSDQAPAGTLASQQQYYATKTLGSNDMHGQAPLLWAATALLRTDCPGVR